LGGHHRWFGGQSVVRHTVVRRGWW
jgi:hypothetical protein